MKYKTVVSEVIKRFDPEGANRYFLFGSSVRNERFHDIDLAVVGNASARLKIVELRDRFYDSSLPYKVDVVDFDAASDEFRHYVTNNEPIVWIP